MKGGAIMKVCRVCLSTDSMLYDMEQYNLDEPYEMVTGINVTGETYPDMLCVECAQRLLNCIKFREKCIRGHTLLTEIWDTYGGLTTQALKSVDRHQSSLVSQLQVKHIEADHYNLYCDHTDTHTDEIPIDSIEEMKTDDVFVVFEIKKDNTDVTIDDFAETKNEDTDTDEMPIDSIEEMKTNDEFVVFEIKKDNTDVTIDNFAEIKNEIDNQFDVIDTEFDANGMHTAAVEIRNDSASRRKVDVKCKSRAPKSSVLKTKRPTKAISKSKKRKTIKKERSDSEASELSKEMDTKAVEKEPKKTVEFLEKRSKDDTYVSNEEFDAMFTITAVNIEEQGEMVAKGNEMTWRNAYIKFKCDVCGKEFVDKVSYDNHIVRHNTKYGEHQCEICKKFFKTKRHLKIHKKIHEREFQCNKCTFHTRHISAAKNHVLFHRGVKFKCSICDMEFQKHSTYFMHKRTKHPTDVVCEFCGYSFVSQRGLHLHKIRQHRLEMDVGQIPSDSPWCEMCNIHFYSEDALKVHISLSDKHRTNDDGKRRPYNELKRCLRKKQSASVTTVKRRKAESTKAGESVPISCEQCDEVLDNPRAYQYHFRRSHPGMTRTVYYSPKHQLCMCEICGRMYQNAGHLKDHMNAHTGEKKFKCDKCEKSFATKMHMQIHSSIHSEDRPLYECPTCGKKFTKSSNRNKHMIIHTGIKAFNCNVCEKSFGTKHQMYAHYKYVHLKVPWPKRPPRRRNVPRPEED